MGETVFTNALIILSEHVLHGTLLVRDGLIIEFSDDTSHLSSAIDCAGDYIAPGLVELHTDNIEHHIRPRPGTNWPAASAVLNHDREICAAGITTVFDAVSIGEVHAKSIRSETLEEICSTVETLTRANALSADHKLHLRCEVSYDGLLDLLQPHIKRNSVGLISLMDHTPGQRQYVDHQAYAEYYQGTFDLSNDELAQFTRERVTSAKKYSAKNRKAVLAIAGQLKLPVASHDDATTTHIIEAKREGITIAEFPTTFEAAQEAHDAGLSVLMGAPNVVRGLSHTGNISAHELAHRNLLDIISSDYVPASALHAALVLAESNNTIDLPRAIAMITLNPARAVGMFDRGEIKAGLRADLIRFRRFGEAPIIDSVWRAGDRIA